MVHFHVTQYPLGKRTRANICLTASWVLFQANTANKAMCNLATATVSVVARYKKACQAVVSCHVP